MSFKVEFMDPYDEISISDLLEMNDRVLQQMLAGFDYKQLATILAKSNAEITERVQANVTDAQWKLIDTEMGYIGIPSPGQFDAARKAIIKAIGKTKGLD